MYDTKAVVLFDCERILWRNLIQVSSDLGDSKQKPFFRGKSKSNLCGMLLGIFTYCTHRSLAYMYFVLDVHAGMGER